MLPRNKYQISWISLKKHISREAKIEILMFEKFCKKHFFFVKSQSNRINPFYQIVIFYNILIIVLSPFICGWWGPKSSPWCWYLIIIFLLQYPNYILLNRFFGSVSFPPVITCHRLVVKYLFLLLNIFVNLKN
jgi:hypothetical protein